MRLRRSKAEWKKAEALVGAMAPDERRRLGLESSTTHPVFESDRDAAELVDVARFGRMCALCWEPIPRARGPQGFTLATFCCDEHARKFHKRVARERKQHLRRRIAQLDL